MGTMAAAAGKLVKATTAFAVPRLTTFASYARVELVPPTPGEVAQAVGAVGKIVKSAQSGAFLNLTTKEATTNVLVALECGLWFFIGECIGKGCLVGYQTHPPIPGKLM